MESRDITTINLDKRQIKLLLTLFGWLLTSSNRKLRDRCSKAVTEILVDNLDLCLGLLKKFEKNNDPYVIQRLYSSVFGALVRGGEKDFSVIYELVNYIYNKIFLSEVVYPDVLVRDYARLTIEYCLFEYPEKLDIDIDKISPPYNSPDVPIMKKIKYEHSNSHNSPKDAIINSMNTENIGTGIYGDFGRYIFYSTLHDFENLDIENCYYYVMDFIFNKIEFKEEYFPNDRRKEYLTYRNDMVKIERIGKKYQWIAFYNLLSMVFDNYKLKGDSENIKHYGGTWETFIRHYDPTLNSRIPIEFNKIRFSTKNNMIEENDFLEFPKLEKDNVEKKAEIIPRLFSDTENIIVLKDNEDNDWIVLNNIYIIEKNENNLNKYEGNRQEIYNIVQAYFVKNDDFNICLEDLAERNFYGRSFPEGKKYYGFFSREYYWSKFLKEYFNKNKWSTVCKETGKYTKEEIYSVLPANNEFLFDSEYDGSLRNGTVSFKIPNIEIVEMFELRQKHFDGFFYNENELVVFDTKLIGEDYGLIIKKNFLFDFLKENNYKIFWSLIGEKRYLKLNEFDIISKWSGHAFFNENHEIESVMNLQKL